MAETIFVQDVSAKSNRYHVVKVEFSDGTIGSFCDCYFPANRARTTEDRQSVVICEICYPRFLSARGIKRFSKPVLRKHYEKFPRRYPARFRKSLEDEYKLLRFTGKLPK